MVLRDTHLSDLENCSLGDHRKGGCPNTIFCNKTNQNNEVDGTCSTLLYSYISVEGEIEENDMLSSIIASLCLLRSQFLIYFPFLPNSPYSPASKCQNANNNS